VRHNVTQVRFPRADAAGKARGSPATSPSSPRSGWTTSGRYRDTFVPVGDAWLIQHRYVATELAGRPNRPWPPPSAVWLAEILRHGHQLLAPRADRKAGSGRGRVRTPRPQRALILPGPSTLAFMISSRRGRRLVREVIAIIGAAGFASPDGSPGRGGVIGITKSVGAR